MPTPNELQEQGVRLFDQHDYEAAARSFQEAKDGYAAEGKDDLVAEMKVNIGFVHSSLNEYQQALELMQEALRTFQEMGDKSRTAQVLGNLGSVYVSLNDKEQALSHYRQAADIFTELGDKERYSEILMAIGQMQIRDWKFFEGAAYYQLALQDKQNLTGTQKIIKRLSNLIASMSGAKIG
jgi:tetratricopeptide (TPR) repeat protein